MESPVTRAPWNCEVGRCLWKLSRATKTSALPVLLLVVCSLSAASQTLDEGRALIRQNRLADAAAVFKALTEKEPTNLGAWSQLATVQSWLKQYDIAIASWEHVLRMNPGNIEFRVGLARVAYWKSDLTRANDELAIVLKQNPKYLDALTLMGDVQMALGQRKNARSYYTQAHMQDPANLELAKDLIHAASPRKWRADIGYASDTYDNFRSHEGGTYLELGYRLNADNNAWVRHEYLNHFGHVDNTFAAGAKHRFSRAFIAHADFAVTPHNDFEPNWRMDGGGDYQLRSWLALTADYRYLNYPGGNVQSYTPGVRFQARPWLALAFKNYISPNVDNTVTNAWLTRADFQASENLSFYGGYARGVEDIPPQKAAFKVVYFTGVVWNFSSRWACRLDWSYEHRPNFYERHSGSPGVTYRF